MFDKRQGGLKTDQSSITVGPSYLLDCSNVIFSREDWMEARHGNPVRYYYSDFATNPTNASISFIPTYETPFLRYTVDSGGAATTVRCMGLFVDDTVSPTRRVTLGETINPATTNKQNICFVTKSGSIYGTVPLITYGYQPYILVNRYPVGFKFQKNYYWLTNKGLYWPSRGLENLATSAPTKVKIPEILGISADSSVETDLAKNFLFFGNKIGIAATVLLETSELGASGTTTANERFIESDPIFLEFKDSFIKPSGVSGDSAKSQKVTVSVNMRGSLVTNPLVSQGRARLRVYRTKQVAVYSTARQSSGELTYTGVPLPVEYWQAAADVPLTTSATAYSIDLTTNDDGIITLPQLYTNPNIEGIEQASTFIRGTKSVSEYKNYYFYSNIHDPGLKSFTLTNLNPSGSTTFWAYYKNYATDSYNLADGFGVTMFVYTNKTSAPTITASNTLLVANDLTYVGNSSGGSQLYIVPTNQRGGVIPYARLDPLFGLTASGATITAIGAAGEFDINKFQTPGIIAHVTAAGRVINLFSYKSVTKSGINTYDFGTTTVVATLDASLGGFLYYIPGESPASLPIYAISGNTSIVGYTVNGTISLLPGLGCPSTPIGYVSSTTSGTYPWSRSAGNLLATIAYIGVLKKSPAELLDQSVTKLVENLKTFDSSEVFLFKKTSNVAEFYATIQDQDYSAATFLVDNSTTFLPTIPTVFSESAANFIEAQNFRNAMYISKVNTPELISEAQFLAPVEVGDRNEAIQATVANTNNLFILKENSTWRLSISSQAINAEVDSLTVFDPTTGCVGGRSAKEINEEIIWLSPKGFVSISGNSMEFIGRDIELEVKEAISLCQGAGLTEQINAFGNEAKRLYGCFIPTTDNPLTGVTYVFDCYLRKWSKWDLPFEHAAVDKTGKLYAIQSFWDGANFRYSTLREDEFTSGNSTAAADQYDVALPLEGATVASVTGNNAVITRGFGPSRKWNSPTSTATNTIEGLGEGAIPLVGQPAYYKIGSTLYAVSVIRDSTTQISVSFTGFTSAPITAGENVNAHSIVLGVVATARYQPDTGATPTSLKQYQEFHVHTASGVHNIGMRYITDSRSTYTSYREFTSYSATRTVYRAYLPIEASRGRYLIREVRHYYPYEKFEMTGQELISREIGSVRNQRS
jgi:hypothetical protein